MFEKCILRKIEVAFYNEIVFQNATFHDFLSTFYCKKWSKKLRWARRFANAQTSHAKFSLAAAFFPLSRAGRPKGEIKRLRKAPSENFAHALRSSGHPQKRDVFWHCISHVNSTWRKHSNSTQIYLAHTRCAVGVKQRSEILIFRH